MTDDDLRKLWRSAGGSFHGPNVEHGDMPEAQLLPFLRRLVDENLASRTLIIDIRAQLDLDNRQEQKLCATIDAYLKDHP